MESAGGPQRHVFLINRIFQIRFILKIVAVVLGSTALAAVAFYLLAEGALSTTGLAMEQQGEDLRAVLLPAVALAALITFALVTVLAVAITVRETHRLAGPLHRFEQNIRLMAEGRFGAETRLRQGDELRGLADAINALSRSVLAASGRARGAASRLREARAELERSGSLAPEAARLIDRGLAEIEEAHGFFRP